MPICLISFDTMNRYLLFTVLSGLFYFPFSGSAAEPVLKVACIGDSITQGIGYGKFTYPSRLGYLLGADYEVRNYGLSGTTLLKKGDLPYWNFPIYQESLSWEPDVVVIKLGTNDCKSFNWRYGEQYVPDFEEFIASYKALASQPRIILATPCPIFGNGVAPFSSTVVANEIAPAVRDLASRFELDLIDYHERMADLAIMFPDKVHPNTKGTSVMAALAFEVITRTDSQLPIPSLRIVPTEVYLADITWPSNTGDYVLQELNFLSEAPERWQVSPLIAENDGTNLRIEVKLRSPQKFYRLWKP